jgi:hypothetical protein
LLVGWIPVVVVNRCVIRLWVQRVAAVNFGEVVLVEEVAHGGEDADLAN